MPAALRCQLCDMAPPIRRLRRAIQADSPCRGRLTKLGKVTRHPEVHGQGRRLLACGPLPGRYAAYQKDLLAKGFTRVMVETLGIGESVLDYSVAMLPLPEETAAPGEANRRAGRKNFWLSPMQIAALGSPR